tara:strand:- start:175 stop:411 length:237 start_codon:yes stop_codon:yes gene_type:complete
MQNQKTVKCSNCHQNCSVKVASICSFCYQKNKITYLCPSDYNQGLDKAKEYNLKDGSCLCYNCWITWFEDENIDSDDF